MESLVILLNWAGGSPEAEFMKMGLIIVAIIGAQIFGVACGYIFGHFFPSTNNFG